jgi:two-component system, cell cycle sensor histidine kinase and response regulator CckA
VLSFSVVAAEAEKRGGSMKEYLRILHLEDDPDYCELVKEMLEKDGWRVELSIVGGCSEFTTALEMGQFDIILADYSLPTYTGIDALHAVRQLCPDTPFLLVSGTIGEQAAIGSLKSGATDYVLKLWPERVVPAVRRAVQEARERSQRKRAESALQESENAFRVMFEAASIGMAQIEVKTRQWLRVNQKLCAITGYPAEELLRMRIPDITHPEDRERDWEFFQRACEGETPSGGLEKRYVRKDGTVTWVNVNLTLVFDLARRQQQILAVIVDITERKLAQEALRKSEERFRTLFELAPDGIYLCDFEGRLVDCNRALEELAGAAKEQLIGKSLLASNLFSESDRLKMLEVLARSTRGEATGPEEYLIRSGDQAVPVEIRTFPINLPGEAVVLGDARDISERTQLEAKLRHAQKMEGIGQLASGIAHDFNNLLAIIHLNSGLLQIESGQSSTQVSDYLDHVVGAVERAANLTRQLLIFSRKEKVQPKPLVLNELVSNMVKMLKRLIREDIDLECCYSDGLPFVQADPGMLEQVVLNLVINARDAMPDGGRLLIRTDTIRLEGGLHLHPEAHAGQFVTLTVSDTGEGIAPENLDRIFEPFFTTKEPGKGTGLGLATVYGIVKQHGGWIEVASRLGQGATFRVFLAASPPPATPVPVSMTMELRGGTEAILLVEDDYSLRAIVRQLLQAYNYTVYEAGCGQEALGVWERHAGVIALLLTDIIMPRGVNGWALAEQLRARMPGLKVVFMSGYCEEASAASAAVLQTGRYFLRKPFSTASLIQMVRQCLDEKGQGI